MPDIFFPGTDNIKGFDCNPIKQKRIVFEGSFIKVVSGSQTLYSLDMSTFGQFGSEFGGSFKKSHYIQSGEYYTLYGGNIAQDQGEVGMIVLKVIYGKSIAAEDRYLTIEYKGNIFTCGTLMFLTGTTKETTRWFGWDLEPYQEDPLSNSDFPAVVTSPVPMSPYLGGMLIYNPTGGEVEVQILVMN